MFSACRSEYSEAQEILFHNFIYLLIFKITMSPNFSLSHFTEAGLADIHGI